MKNILNLILLILSSYYSGCVSMSTLQTAKTLPSGESRQTFGGGTYVSSSKDSVTGETVETNLPYFEYTARMGLSEKFDAGLKLTVIGSYAADFKYNILNQEKFALATGLGLGYMSYKITSGDQETKVSYVDAYVPLYMSYDFNESFSLYLSPKYVYRKTNGADSSTDDIKGLGIGTKIGQNKGVFIEAAVYEGHSKDKITQYNISYFW